MTELKFFDNSLMSLFSLIAGYHGGGVAIASASTIAGRPMPPVKDLAKIAIIAALNL